VKPGDIVDQGSMIAVLEAMKMQNELTSPANGVVKKLLVKPGDTVEADTVVLELGPLEEEDNPENEKKVVA
jgi:biotin carboxyl carrier protein